MNWLLLFLASSGGAIYLAKAIEKRLTMFLATYPEGLKNTSDAENHQAINKKGLLQTVLIGVLALVALVSLIGVTATYGGIGLLPIAIVMSLLNQWSRQFTQKGKDFDQLYKDYQAEGGGKK